MGAAPANPSVNVFLDQSVSGSTARQLNANKMRWEKAASSTLELLFLYIVIFCRHVDAIPSELLSLYLEFPVGIVDAMPSSELLFLYLGFFCERNF